LLHPPPTNGSFASPLILRHDLTPSSRLGRLMENDSIVKYHVGNSDIERLKMHHLQPRGFIDVQRLATAVFMDVLPPLQHTQFGSNTLAVACGMQCPYYDTFKVFVGWNEWGSPTPTFCWTLGKAVKICDRSWEIVQF
jgi:hypothetical protein